MKRKVFKKILCGYDGSEGAGKALLKASQIAQQNNAKLHVVYIIDEMDLRWGLRIDASVIWDRNINELEEGIKEAAMRKAKEIISRAKKKLKGIDAEYIIRIGDITEELKKLEEELGCDLVVLGSHGHRGLKQLILGSAPENLVRMSSKPVLIVR